MSRAMDEARRCGCDNPVAHSYADDTGPHAARVVSRDEAVKAAAEALFVADTRYRVKAEAAVTAAWPHIETAVRAQIAAEIRAVADEVARTVGRERGSRVAGLEHAAQIADPKETP